MTRFIKEIVFMVTHNPGSFPIKKSSRILVITLEVVGLQSLILYSVMLISFYKITDVNTGFTMHFSFDCSSKGSNNNKLD